MIAKLKNRRRSGGGQSVNDSSVCWRWGWLLCRQWPGTFTPRKPPARRANWPIAYIILYAAEHDGTLPAASLTRQGDFFTAACSTISERIGAYAALGFVLLGVGFLDRRWRLYAAWLAASIFLIAALPRKFHEMNYYFMAVLPPLCIVAGLGWGLVVKRLRPGRVALMIWLLVALVISLRYAGGPLLVIPAEDRGVLSAAGAVGRLTEEDEPIVVMHGTAIVMPYYCNRPAWCVTADEDDIGSRLEEYHRLGARFFVVVGEDKAEFDLPEVVRGEGFLVYRL